jgi:hypothetical protein
MSGLAISAASRSLPATAVFQLSPRRPVEAPSSKGDDVLLAAVTHPPRIGETRPIGALLPSILAGYGVAQSSEPGLVPTLDLQA